MIKASVAAGLAPAVGVGVGAGGAFGGVGRTAPPPDCRLGRLTDRDLASLSRSMVEGGRLVFPTSKDYDTVRLIWNETVEALPLAIARPRGPRDVSAVIGWCRERGITPRLRSGGHSFAGYSTGESLVIDLREMTDITYETDGTVTLAAGGLLGEVGRRLYCDAGLTIPMGTCPTVGLSGLTMAGGLGYHVRSHGLTIDRLKSATVVLADGSVIETDETRDADLFWALRGGGMGSYGVVTAWRFDPIPAKAQSLVSVRWAPTDFVEMMEAYQTWLGTLPPIGFASATFITEPNGSVNAGVVMLDEGDGTNLLPLAEQLISLATRPSTGPPSLHPVAAPDCMAEDEFSVDAGFRKSRYAMTPVGSDTLALIRDGFLKRASNPDLAGTKAFLLMDAGGGLIDTVAPTDTAFYHRNALFCGQFGAVWNGVADPALAGAASESWLRELYDGVVPGFDGGCYPGYWDAEIVDWPSLYYGENFPRLVQTKAAYDPENFFRFQRSIPLAADG